MRKDRPVQISFLELPTKCRARFFTRIAAAGQAIELGKTRKTNSISCPKRSVSVEAFREP